MHQIVDWFRYGWHRIAWGLQVVGPWATLRGVGRLAALAVRRPERSVLHLSSGGSLEFANPSQRAPSLLLFGDVVDPEFFFLRALPKPPQTVLDVGAAIGQFAIFASLLPSEVIHAYEPSDANLETLTRNIERNGVADRVVVHRLALSNEAGEAAFTTADRTYLSRLESAGESTPSEETVPVRTLDGELASSGIDRVDVLKINVAGDEPAVMDGAVDALAAGRVGIMVLLIGVESLPWYKRLGEMGYVLGFYHPVDHVFHRIETIDERLLSERPWPARHILAVHDVEPHLGILADMDVRTFLS